MANIIMIAQGTKRRVNNIDDVVDVLDDNVGISGGAYEHFTIMHVRATKAEVWARLEQQEKSKNAELDKYPCTLKRYTEEEKETLVRAKTIDEIETLLRAS